MSIEVSAEDIARDPAWHLYDLDLQRGEMHFLETSPETFSVSAFLDNRIAYTRERMHGFPIDSVITAFQQFPPRPVQMDFLFHSSFCCSSLLARSLQFGDRTLVLREPWVLRRLADTRRAAAAQGQPWGAQGEALLDIALTLLGKTFHDGQCVLIKPTHVANNLAADMLALRPTAKGVALYSDLETFLVSNLKKSDDTKQKMPALARVFDLDTGYTRRLGNLSLESLDFLQQAAVIWHAQMLRFRELLESPAGERLKSLDSAKLLADPASALRAAAGFLGYPVTSAELAAVLAGPTWTTHAKDPFTAYDKDARERENREVAGQHGDRIRNTLRWAEQLLAREPVGLPLPRALL